MTHTRPRVAIVCPDLALLSHFDSISSLLGQVDAAVFSFNGSLVPSTSIAMPLFLFEALPDMPGYMRGLEDRLAEYDVIIGIDTWQLSSFQAMRAAVKHGRAFGCIVTSQRPFGFVDYPNIRAIQSDVLARTERFFASSQVARQVLLAEGVPESKVAIVPPTVDASKWSFDTALRKKFRQYLGIPAGAMVVLYHGPMQKQCRPQNLIEAASILRRAGITELPKLKLLFVGEGDDGKDLRYLASDARIGGLCMFMSQDPTPFMRDLLCASDLCLMPLPQEDARASWYGLNVLRAMAAGVVPMNFRGTSEAEWSGPAGLPLEGDSPSALAASLARILRANDTEVASWRQSVGTRAAQGFSPITRALQWNCEIGQLMTVAEQRAAHGPTLMGRIRSTGDLIDGGRHQDALVEIENLLLGVLPGEKYKSQLLCMKGELLNQTGDLEGAINAFQAAMVTGEGLARCYRGLGYVSVKSHSHEEAISFFKKAVGIDAEDHQSMLGIGLVYRRLKLFEDALYWAEKCLTLAPQTMSAILLAAQTASETNSVREAIETLERLRDVTGENRNILVALAQLYYKVGKADRASELMATLNQGDGGKTGAAKTAA